MKRFINLTISALAMLFAMCACEEKSDVTPEISASPESVTFAGAGETKNIAVTCNVDDWSYSGQPDWITVTADGNSLALKAEANPSTSEERTGVLTLTAGSATFPVELKQLKAEKYAGYTELSTCSLSYGGSIYQMFMPDCEGGSAYLDMASEDGRVSVYVEFFTEEYLTAEEVMMPVGEIVKGDEYDSFVDMAIAGVPMTYVAGGSYIITDEDGEEEFSGGSSITYITGDVEEVAYITDGKFTIALNDDDTYLIKLDLKDADGNDLKYYYEGELVFDASEAMFPVVGEVDPTKIESVMCTYNGDSEFGTTALTLTLSAESGASTNVEFYVPTTTFDALDIAGLYAAPEGENTGAAGTLDKGSLLEMEGFSFPMGSYIMFSFGNYFIADGASMLMITKDEGAETYTIIANMQNTDEAHEGYAIMAMGATVEFIDGTAYDEEEW